MNLDEWVNAEKPEPPKSLSEGDEFVVVDGDLERRFVVEKVGPDDGQWSGTVTVRRLR